MNWVDLGQRSYQETWDRQEEHRKQILSGQAECTVFSVEHEPTFTFGRAEKGENLLQSPSWLKSKGFAIVETNRGGKVTYHGPGQWVIYPVVGLKNLKMGVKDYVCALEKTMIQTCDEFGVRATRKEGQIGAWVDHRKIGSIGIHIRKQVSIHGLALNVNPDFEAFSYITPCGIEGVEMTSLSGELDRTVRMEEVLPVLKKSMGELFSCDFDSVER